MSSSIITLIVFGIALLFSNFIVLNIRQFFMKLTGANLMFFNIKTHIMVVLVLALIMLGGMGEIFDNFNQVETNDFPLEQQSNNQQEITDFVNSSNQLIINNISNNKKLEFDYIEASSRLYEEGFDYDPYHLIDGDLNTLWVEGIEGEGEGESIMISNGKETQLVNQIKIYNGFPDDALYYKNSRVKSIMIEFDNGTIVYEILSDSREPQVITLDEPISTNWINFTIVSTYPGTKFQDTCITEIEIY